jgi:hypothetical protein
VLQFNALLITRAPSSGLLQDYAGNARAFRAALVCTRFFLFSRSLSGPASVRRIPRFRFRGWQHSSAFPHAADLLFNDSSTSSRLV